ncbi:hypothetical protein KGA66_19485 [Actinocrinis puniceicyclus]|uniref:Uncharacterized protein n=1 Tax=Actinocrinis puniceicyclus TaxID=977794 RepID=A0A8J8BEJ7_9ACTN|nr:hypothetical protein [Actinocrinis puniceicyclus]MBS2965241.1 hypothetical protein [Actinocrinis puniceicyclus]
MRVEQFGADQDGDDTGHDRASAAELFDSEELRQLSGYARLAELLKEAHGVLRGMELDLPDRADFVRRLLVITAASRHDQADAMRRLGLFLSAIDEKRGAAAGGKSGSMPGGNHCDTRVISALGD